jgi:hypothetical protein
VEHHSHQQYDNASYKSGDEISGNKKNKREFFLVFFGRNLAANKRFYQFIALQDEESNGGNG